jgi:hypothetical protein
MTKWTATHFPVRTTVAKVEPEWRRLHRVADRLAPELRTAFLRAMTLLRERRLLATLRGGTGARRPRPDP